MTTYSKRRGRRSLAAILAAMLIASVLAVVAGSPAQAANTSSEYLIDHDADPSTDKVREFAGRDRYDTAVKLATRFANDRGGIGTVPNAFVASGESLVDAVSVAGLAGFMDAPVLLTRGDTLHGGVADYIEDFGVSNIYVLGGENAISKSVEEALGELAGVNTPMRIAGDDRYDTSAAIASNLAGESWCGTNENSAIIVNGADDDLFNAVAIGPVANRLELPVLLTAGDGLVDAVLSYIEAEDVEHAVIVGGETSVSEGVEQALSDAGVDTVDRIDGDSAGEVSVAIAEVIGDDCADDLSPVSNNAVALINSDNVIDGIPAAPVLADDANQLGGGLIPILAVSDTLPASVRDYLASTPEEDTSGNKIHMRILAIGGTAAVSDSVVEAAADAAGSADALSVEIFSTRRDKDDNRLPVAEDDDLLSNDQIVLKFSDDIFREDGTATPTGIRNRLEDILFVNGLPVDIASQTDDSADTVCTPDTITVTLERDLKAGDVIEIVESTIKIGAAGDQRTVQATKITVPDAPADTQRPSIRIVAIKGHSEIYALVSDNKALDIDEDNTLLTAAVVATTASGSPIAVPTDANGDDLIETVNGATEVSAVRRLVTVNDENTDKPIYVALAFTLDDGDPDTTSSTTDGVVVDGDRFRINRGAVVDAKGNQSQITTAGEVSAVSKLQVSNVLMSELKHTANAVVLIPSAHKLPAAPTTVRSTDPTAPSPGVASSATDGDGNITYTPLALANQNPAMWLQAKGDGPAAGVFGNLWKVRADRASDWDKAKDPEVKVFASAKDRRVVIRIANGEPKFADLKEALEANATVSSLFNVIVDNEYGRDGDDAGTDPDDTCKAANPKLRHEILPETATDATTSTAETTADDAVDADDPNSFTGGVTKARLRVIFNGWVESISATDDSQTPDADNSQGDRLLNAVFAGASKRYQDALNLTDLGPARTAVLSDLGTAADGTTAPLALPAISGPTQAVTISITARGALGALKLPAPRDIVDLPDGFDKILSGDDKGDPVDNEDGENGSSDTPGVQRTDTNQTDGPGFTAVANGYGDNGADSGNEENDFNYGSKSRIVRSSSVPAPPR